MWSWEGSWFCWQTVQGRGIILDIFHIEKKIIWLPKVSFFLFKREQVEETTSPPSSLSLVSHMSTGTPCTGFIWLDVTLALCYIKTNKLLNAFLILLFSGAAGWVLTWLTKGSLWLPHLFVHPGQTQPEEERNREKQQKVRYLSGVRKLWIFYHFLNDTKSPLQNQTTYC